MLRKKVHFLKKQVRFVESGSQLTHPQRGSLRDPKPTGPFGPPAGPPGDRPGVYVARRYKARPPLVNWTL